MLYDKYYIYENHPQHLILYCNLHFASIVLKIIENIIGQQKKSKSIKMININPHNLYQKNQKPNPFLSLPYDLFSLSLEQKKKLLFVERKLRFVCLREREVMRESDW